MPNLCQAALVRKDPLQKEPCEQREEHPRDVDPGEKVAKEKVAEKAKTDVVAGETIMQIMTMKTWKAKMMKTRTRSENRSTINIWQE